MALLETTTSIVLENDRAQIFISKKDSSVEKIIDKKTGRDIRGEETRFFKLEDTEREEVKISSLQLSNDVITLESECGKISIKVCILSDYFTFELVKELPEGIWRIILAHAKFDYDYTNKNNVGANGIAMTYWVNPDYYPDAKSLVTTGLVYRHLRSAGAKYALIIAPIIEMRDIIKSIYKTVDKNVCIYSEKGGAWGRDCPDNFGGYIIQYTENEEHVLKNIEFYKYLGVRHVDFHPGPKAHRLGDYKFTYFKDNADYKKRVSDVLEKNGLSAELHTYSHYIDPECETILSKPEYQKDMKVLKTYTLDADLSDDAVFIPTVESTEDAPRTPFFRNAPYVFIGEELIHIVPEEKGFKILKRGCAGTKITRHEKGESVKHLDGHYGGITPVLGSEAFLLVARNIARVYNEGGFKAIYLDALDGILQHCSWNDGWYYMAMFVCEILNHTHDYPVLEYATMWPSIWAGRGRIGAYDVPVRANKNHDKGHANYCKDFIDRFSASTLGWYDFYSRDFYLPGKLPPNVNFKYTHTDTIHHLGSLALMYNFSNVWNGGQIDHLKMSPGMKRNIDIYKKYDFLRTSGYFEDSYLEKARNGKWEYHLKESDNGKFSLIEKHFETKRVENFENSVTFSNPFERQCPFVRIEHLLSTKRENPFTLLELDENRDLSEQTLEAKFTTPLDLSKKLVKVVRVFGNGKKGTVAIKVRNGEMYLMNVIDTDFEGWREFTLIECDNGERPDLPFEKKETSHAIYRRGFDITSVRSIQIETSGDVTGVRMGDVVACDYLFEVIRHPVLKVGEQKVMFECDLASGDFIEFDGEHAFVVDKNTNAREIYFEGKIDVCKGDFTAEVEGFAYNSTVPRTAITFGFTGEEL